MDAEENGKERGDGGMKMSEEETRKRSEEEFNPQPSTSTAASAATDRVETEDSVFVKPETPSVKFILNTPYLNSQESILIKHLYTLFRKIVHLVPAVTSFLRTLSSCQAQSGSLSQMAALEQFLYVVHDMFEMHKLVVSMSKKPAQLPKTSRPQNNAEDKGGSDRYVDEMKKGKEETETKKERMEEVAVKERGTGDFSDFTTKASEQGLQKDIAGSRSEDNETKEPPEADPIQTNVDSQVNTETPDQQLSSDPADLPSQKSRDIGTLARTSTPSHDVCTSSTQVSDFQQQRNNPDRSTESRKEKEQLEWETTQRNSSKHARECLQQQNKGSADSGLSKDITELSGTESSTTYHDLKKNTRSSDQQLYEDATRSRSQDMKEDIPPASDSTEGREDTTNTAGLSSHQQNEEESEPSSHSKGTDTSVAEPSRRSKQPGAEPKPEPRTLLLKQLCGELFVASGCCASLGTFLHSKMCWVPQSSPDTRWTDVCAAKCLKMFSSYVECCDAVKSCALRHQILISVLMKILDWWEIEANKELTVHEEDILAACLITLYCMAQHAPALRQLRGLNLIARLLYCCRASSSPFHQHASMLLVSVLMTEDEAMGMELTEPQMTTVLAPLLGLSPTVTELSRPTAVAVQNFSMNARNRQAFRTKYAEELKQLPAIPSRPDPPQ